MSPPSPLREGPGWVRLQSAASLGENLDSLFPTPGLLLTTNVRLTWSRTLDPLLQPLEDGEMWEEGRGAAMPGSVTPESSVLLSFPTPRPGANPELAQRFRQELPSWSSRSPFNEGGSHTGLGSPYRYETSF